ncbi:DUF6701 domain-containing protein [Colwellia sp. C1TZA3]|uniref:DUF6701 domain-containing protein n=1 Tax=Colwellia sp. C1TZA3 TaxID=2508879 RepID=UPI0011B95A8D|nr:DUF6701 domain-containing protein [Colwellia sp. C1TZA3]TWX68272.1 DUF3494 domain-containing protein [Colwellia sp. C1TZA3]
MTYTKQCLFILILFVVSSAQAALPPQLDAPLDNLTIYSSAAITMGASSKVGGNIQVEAAATIGASSIVTGHLIAGAAVTLDATVTVGGFVEARDAGTIGADSTVGGHFTTGDAATLGATTIDGNVIVGGDLTAGAAILVGTKAVIGGNVRSGASASTDFGANTVVEGDATAGTALTLGADVIIGGNAQAGTGAVALGVKAAVTGDARAGTSVTLAANATVGGTIIEESIEQFTNAPKEPVDDQSPQLAAVQAELAAMEAPAANQLTTSMTVSKTLKKGVYHTTALTTTAGITITFDGEGVDGHWLINSDSFVAFGASTVVKLLNVTENSTITWNAGGYISAGASVNLIGSFFAGSYILTGASTTLEGVGDGCGGFFTTTGAVTLGASNLIGPLDCKAQIPTQIDHYEIIHDGQGLTCEAETVTIKACTNTIEDGSCTLSNETVTLDVKATGSSSSVVDTISFTGTGTASIPYAVAESTLLSLENASVVATNSLVCSNGNTSSCQLDFVDAGFIFFSGDNDTALPNQISGIKFDYDLKIKAINACAGLFTGDTNIDLSQKNVNPEGTSGLLFSINGNNIAKKSNGISPTSTTLSFDADGVADILTPIYYDAGKISLYANYEVDGVIVSGSSNAFWVSPAALVVSAQLEGKDLNGASATATPTHKAGEDFDLTVTAYNHPGNITQNYSPGNIQVKLERTGPTLTNSVDGDLTYALASSQTTSTSPEFEDATLNNFLSGISTYNAAQYSEVGLLNLDVQDSDYGNVSIIIPAAAIDIGRFTPDHFQQTVVEQGSLDAVCNQNSTFAYVGQVVSDPEKGAISYLVNPVVELTAKNVQGLITKNYTAPDYNKLIAAANFIIIPTADSTISGKNGSLLPLTANLLAGTLSFGLPLDGGILHYELADNDNFFYPRNENSELNAQDNNIDFLIDQDNFVDSDGIAIISPKNITSTASINIRFGRAAIENSFGPETVDLPQSFSTQYLNANGRYVVNEQDSCTNYDADNIKLTSGTLNKNATSVNDAAGQIDDGETRAIILTAPGAGKQGNINIEYEVYSWLKYDWNWNGVDAKLFDENPSAIATFGVFRGNDRIISWQEIFNQ